MATCACAIGISVLLLCGSALAAEGVICEPGSGAGQCLEPKGVTVDRTQGLLYVADSGNRRVGVFDVDDDAFLRAFGWDVAPEGAPGDTPANALEVCTSVCQAARAWSSSNPEDGPGQFSFINGIAVDNDPSSPAFGDVYVFDGRQFGEGNNRIQRFRSNGEFVLAFDGFAANIFAPRIDVGPGGVLHVVDAPADGERRLRRFSHEGDLVSTCAPLSGVFEFGVGGFAVDSVGSFYLASAGASGVVRKYDAGCNLLDTFHPSFNIQALAVDSADALLVADQTEAPASFYAYDSTGEVLRVIYGDGLIQHQPNGMAFVSTVADEFFASEGGGGPEAARRVLRVAAFEPGPVFHPSPALSAAQPVNNTDAMLNAKVNPEGKASTYHFEYVDDETYQEDISQLGPGHGFDRAVSTAPAAVVPPANPQIVSPLFRLASVTGQIGCATPADPPQPSCLAPETTYHFRAVATNADVPPGEQRVGPEGQFETGPPLEVLATWATQVGSDAARLHAEANPLGIPLRGHFEYVEEEQFKASGFADAISMPEVELGSGESPVATATQLHSLQPDTTYMYRFVAENFYAERSGATGALSTYALPDPVLPCIGNEEFRGGASAALPDCRAYEMVSPVDKAGGEITVSLALRGNPAEHVQSAAVVPANGRGLTYSSDRAFGDASSAPYTSQYIATRVAGSGWSSHGISPPRVGIPFFPLIFLQSQYKAFSPDLSWALLRSDSEPALEPEAITGFANLYRRDNATDGYQSICPEKPTTTKPADFEPEPQAFSPDFGVMMFRASEKLTSDASGARVPSSTKGIHQLYGCADGLLQLVSVLPPALGGKASATHSSAGTGQSTGGDHREDSVHNALSADGSRVYWTASIAAAKTPVGDESGAGRIYLRVNPFAPGAECAGPTRPCTVPVSGAVGGPGSDAKALFWTASPDGSVAVFSFTEGPLAGNLYEFDAETGATELIAPGVSGVAAWSEDASRLYFVSDQALAPGALAGKDNLYLYENGERTLVAALPGGATAGHDCSLDARVPFRRCTRATEDGRRLAFVSSESLTGYDNTDAVSGETDAEIFLYDAVTADLLCVSCNPSGARPSGAGVRIPGNAARDWFAAQLPTWDTAFYAPRVLSADGRRLFFESFDGLLPTDTNGALDVYQWQEPGKGDCETTSANYFPAQGGCLDLISSGKSPSPSEFVDASLDGADVFFKTSASLLPQDPGQIDVYDAREGGGMPVPPASPPPCEGEACQSSTVPPPAQTPSSTSFEGPGNAVQPRCKKGKRPIRRGGKVRCVKAKGKGKSQRGGKSQGKRAQRSGRSGR